MERISYLESLIDSQVDHHSAEITEDTEVDVRNPSQIPPGTDIVGRVDVAPLSETRSTNDRRVTDAWQSGPPSGNVVLTDTGLTSSLEQGGPAFVNPGHTTSDNSQRSPYGEQTSQITPQANLDTLTPSSVTSLGPQQHIAHEVGMLSLANSMDPKYLGPSSGVTLARLMYASAPQTQGLSNLVRREEPQYHHRHINPAPLPSSRDIRRFVNAYFTNLHPFYPFLDQNDFLKTAETVRRESQRLQTCQDLVSGSHDATQLYLVVFLGAKILESKMSCSNNAEDYLSTAMIHLATCTLHDTLRGLQTLLLLMLSSLYSPNGLNAWFLRSSLIAGCIDLGIHRKTQYDVPLSRESIKNHDLRSGIFWSAYSLDRTFSVVLGRPLTLRDEALDIGFPGDQQGKEIQRDATDLGGEENERPGKRRRLAVSSPASFSFRFDRIVAETKLMLHRVCQSPNRFPWPTNFGDWQADVHKNCTCLLDEVYAEFDRIDVAESSNEIVIPFLELKYHQTIMLLYRPSPSIPRPSALALRFCFESAMETIRIYSMLHHSACLTSSWLDAHTTFIAGITICYSLWMSPQIRQVTPAKLFAYYTNMTKQLLEVFSKNWSVAYSACQKFEALAEWAKVSFQDDMTNDNAFEPVISTDFEKDQEWPDIPTLPFDNDIDWSAMTIDYENAASLPDEFQEVPDWFALEGWLKDS